MSRCHTCTHVFKDDDNINKVLNYFCVEELYCDDCFQTFLCNKCINKKVHCNNNSCFKLICKKCDDVKKRRGMTFCNKCYYTYFCIKCNERFDDCCICKIGRAHV